MEICKYDDCTGCFACLNACPRDCITIEPDKYGELHPFIDETKCINCHKCNNICPGNKIDIKLYTPMHCYAAYRLDKEKRADSASGGIGALLSEKIISDNGVVIGVKFDGNLIPIHYVAKTLTEIEDFKGSKYVQSRINITYKEAKKYLQEGKKVLFIGTPCQIAGLKAYLMNKNYENLITCDLICHGVSSYKYLHENIIASKYNNIVNITFRSNRPKSNFKFKLFDNQKCIRNERWYMNNYFHGFLRGMSLRESCYKCKYAKKERIADITIGDFIGLGKKIPFDGIKENASVILTNTNKGESLIQEIKTQLFIQERNYKEAIDGGISLRRPFPRYKNQSKFRDLYLKIGYEQSINKLMKWDKREQLFLAIISKLKRIIFRG